MGQCQSRGGPNISSRPTALRSRRSRRGFTRTSRRPSCATAVWRICRFLDPDLTKRVVQAFELNAWVAEALWAGKRQADVAACDR